MTFSHGMNTDAVREQAGRIDTVVNELKAVDTAIERTLAGLREQWHGPDLERFQGWWREQHKPNLARATDSIAGLAQSARNNAEEQDRASENGGASGPGGRSAPTPFSPPDGNVAPSVPGDVSRHRDWRDVQRGYDDWSRSIRGRHPRFSDPNVSQYQCTGWANYRWHELGYEGDPISGNGGAMAGNAPGETSATPTLHAMASRGVGTSSSPGHVMIVEEMSSDGSRIRVSEMNVGDKNWNVANPDEFRDQRWIERGSNGNFYDNNQVISFADFPG